MRLARTHREYINPEVVGSTPTCRFYPPCLLPANPVNGYGWILGDSSSGRARGIWGYSSVGRTSALQAEGQGFESPYFHHAVADSPGSPDHPGAKPYHVCAKAGVDHAAKRMLLLQPESDAGQLPA